MTNIMECELYHAREHAELLAGERHYDEAIQIFETSAETARSYPEYRQVSCRCLFMASLCRICKGDIYSAREFIKYYANLDVNLLRMGHYTILARFITAYEKNNRNVFISFIKEHAMKLPIIISVLLSRVCGQMK